MRPFHVIEDGMNHAPSILHFLICSDMIPSRFTFNHTPLILIGVFRNERGVFNRAL